MDNEQIPVHVGIIMDGNGRWAKKRLMPRNFGHKAGMNRMLGLVEEAQASGIKYLTLYALSTENLARPAEEVEALLGLIKKYFSSNAEKLIKHGASLKVIGDLSALPEDVRKVISNGLEASPDEADFTLILAINYGTRAEILQAVNRAVRLGESVTEESFSRLMYTADIPDPDFIIRTGGEKRLSNFLTYQGAYAELYFTDVLFPDFTKEELEKALSDYRTRTRRFGKL